MKQIELKKGFYTLVECGKWTAHFDEEAEGDVQDGWNGETKIELYKFLTPKDREAFLSDCSVSAGESEGTETFKILQVFEIL